MAQRMATGQKLKTACRQPYRAQPGLLTVRQPLQLLRLGARPCGRLGGDLQPEDKGRRNFHSAMRA